MPVPFWWAFFTSRGSSPTACVGRRLCAGGPGLGVSGPADRMCPLETQRQLPQMTSVFLTHREEHLVFGGTLRKSQIQTLVPQTLQGRNGDSGVWARTGLCGGRGHLSLPPTTEPGSLVFTACLHTASQSPLTASPPAKDLPT